LTDQTETVAARQWGRRIAAGVTVMLIGVGVLVATSDSVDIPFTHVKNAWSVGIATGSSPLEPVISQNNPIFSKHNTAGSEVLGVADPFLVVDGDTWYMYFEVIEANVDYPNREKGIIGFASSTDEGATWNYDGVALDEEWHLSYPLVFAHDGAWWMVPEASGSDRVTLYRADSPTGPWLAHTAIVEGAFTDPTIFVHDRLWWMLAASTTVEPDDTLRLFHAVDLEGPWREHPMSPVVIADGAMARPAGRVVSDNGVLYRFAQDSSGGYGRAVRVFRIETLTTTDYLEVEAIDGPLLKGSGEGWNELGMHHVAWVQLDDGAWIATVDGFTSSRVFGFNVG
jgi:hypothetical protein